MSPNDETLRDSIHIHAQAVDDSASEGDASEPEVLINRHAPPLDDARAEAMIAAIRLFPSSPTSSSPARSPPSSDDELREEDADARPWSPPRTAGEIVHLSRKLCGSFTSRREDGSSATYYNGWYGFVRPAGAALDGTGICRDDLFLHPSDVQRDYNPTVGDAVLFRRGSRNGRLTAVDVDVSPPETRRPLARAA